MIKKLNLKSNAAVERLFNGIVKENPLFVLLLGLCPALYVTTSALNGIGMGLATLFVLLFSNLVISLIRNSIPDKLRLPAYIIIIAIFVTIAEAIIKTALPALDKALGIYIPLIVVNCIVMSRVENYAAKNKVLLAVFDAFGMGLGFTLALMMIGAIREFIGVGELFGFRVMPPSYPGVSIFVLAPGAFFIMAFLFAIHKKLKVHKVMKETSPDAAEDNKKETSPEAAEDNKENPSPETAEDNDKNKTSEAPQGKTEKKVKKEKEKKEIKLKIAKTKPEGEKND